MKKQLNFTEEYKNNILSTQISENDNTARKKYFLLKNSKSSETLSNYGIIRDEIITSREDFSSIKKSEALKELQRREVLNRRDEIHNNYVEKKSSRNAYKLTKRLKKISFNPKNFVSMKNLETPRNLQISKQKKIKSYRRNDLSVITQSRGSPKNDQVLNSKALNFRINSTYLVTEIKSHSELPRESGLFTNRTKEVLENIEDFNKINFRIGDSSPKFEKNKSRNLWKMHEYNIIEMKKRQNEKSHIQRTPKNKIFKTFSDRNSHNMVKIFEKNLDKLNQKYSKKPRKKILFKDNEEQNKKINERDIPYTTKNLTKDKDSLQRLKNSETIQDFKPLNSYKNDYKKYFDEYKNFISDILVEEESPILTKMISDAKIKRGVIDELAKKNRMDVIITTEKYIRKNRGINRNVQNFQNIASKIALGLIDENKQKQKFEKVVGALMNIQETRDKYDSNVRLIY